MERFIAENWNKLPGVEQVAAEPSLSAQSSRLHYIAFHSVSII